MKRKKLNNRRIIGEKNWKKEKLIVAGRLAERKRGNMRNVKGVKHFAVASPRYCGVFRRRFLFRRTTHAPAPNHSPSSLVFQPLAAAQNPTRSRGAHPPVAAVGNAIATHRKRFSDFSSVNEFPHRVINNTLDVSSSSRRINHGERLDLNGRRLYSRSKRSCGRSLGFARKNRRPRGGRKLNCRIRRENSHRARYPRAMNVCPVLEASKEWPRHSPSGNSFDL